MTKAERRLVRQWEDALIDDYRTYRSNLLLNPLYERLAEWKSGKLNDDAAFDALHTAHKENQERYNFFVQKKTDLVYWIQFDPWFDDWLAQHPAPVGAEVVPDELKTERWQEMEQLESDQGGVDHPADTPPKDEV
jgi:hypothetical protein